MSNNFACLIALNLGDANIDLAWAENLVPPNDNLCMPEHTPAYFDPALYLNVAALSQDKRGPRERSYASTYLDLQKALYSATLGNKQGLIERCHCLAVSIGTVFYKDVLNESPPPGLPLELDPNVSEAQPKKTKIYGCGDTRTVIEVTKGALIPPEGREDDKLNSFAFEGLVYKVNNDLLFAEYSDVFDMDPKGYITGLAVSSGSLIIRNNMGDMRGVFLRRKKTEYVLLASNEKTLRSVLDSLAINNKFKMVNFIFKLPKLALIQRKNGEFLKGDFSDMHLLSLGKGIDEDLEEKGRAECAVLFSGGLDSVVLATLALQLEGFNKVHLLNVDYGGSITKKELDVSRALAQYFDEKYPGRVVWSTLQAPWLGLLGGSKLLAGGTSPEDGPAPATFIPARNINLLAMAAAYCEVHNIEYLSLGATNDSPGYRDCTDGFVDAAREILHYCSKTPLQLYAPLASLSKLAIYALGQRIEAPIDLAWSCYEDGDIHCGKCTSCLQRLTAAAHLTIQKYSRHSEQGQFIVQVPIEQFDSVPYKTIPHQITTLLKRFNINLVSPVENKEQDG